QITRAYDELDRLDRELGNLFNTAPSTDPVSPSMTITQQISPSSSSVINQNNKRPHSHTGNGLTSRSTTNGHHCSTPANVNPARPRNSTSEPNSTNGNQYEPLNSSDIEEETRELQELISKGDAAIHNEISVFVYRYDLKQSQIARMASVNQAYVSKFLRGDLFDLSENGRMAICRWYIRYRKIVQSIGGGPPSAEIMANFTSGEPPIKVPRLAESQTNSNTSSASFDAPKRTRFTFRPEHLDILEKAFLDNPYPDPRRREEIARICNDARTRVDGNNELLTDRDRVTDAIVTHWFQNKRKMAKSQRASIHDESLPYGLSNNNSNNHLSAMNDFENINGDEDVNIHQQAQPQKSAVPIVDMDYYETPSSLLDPQMAAYRAIMSRMVPFANNVNGIHSPKRLVKQEPFQNADESSQGEESNSSSPLNEQLSP
ncbi:unnamed protein product, partial [Adineta ricciae]